MLLTSILPEDIEKLEEIFSYLTPDGWKIPAWLNLLKEAVNDNATNKTTDV